MPAVLAVHEVEQSFGQGPARLRVLRGVSMEVQAGEIVLLVGPSGSGKSTLLSILGCLLAPEGGEVEVRGRPVRGLSAAQLTALRQENFGFVFQTFNLFPTLSALDNVQLALAMRGVPLGQARKQAAALLERVGLAGRQNSRPAQLSTGECQRVAIARALVHEPAVLFADEPTASLDAENGQAVMELLRGLVRRRGMTLVVVSHDPRIFSFADRILRLEQGQLAPDGQETSQPETRFAPLTSGTQFKALLRSHGPRVPAAGPVVFGAKSAWPVTTFERRLSVPERAGRSRDAG